MISESQSIKMIWYTKDNHYLISSDFYMVDSSSYNSLDYLFMWKMKDRTELISCELLMISINIDDLSLYYYDKKYMKGEFI